MKKNKILVIDDDQGILEAMKIILTDAGFNVVTVLKTEEVYNSVAKFNPNLIFLDLLLSGRDGKEICMNIKANPGTNNIPIIMISAHPSASKSAKNAGADGFISKPFEVDEILDLVKKLIK